TVRYGDSFWSIASKYGISMYTLAANNGKSIYSLIYPGESLYIR
ncbi:LysM peptidoglycan-binding domain-containing protein, partial [Lacticaseibacillus rhamnosus]